MWIITCQNATLLEITCGGSFLLILQLEVLIMVSGRVDFSALKTMRNWKRFHYVLWLNIVTYPSPVNAQQAWICQTWSFIDVRFKCCEISAADMEPLISCLLAKISTAALRKSWKLDKNEIKINICYTTKYSWDSKNNPIHHKLCFHAQLTLVRFYY